MYTYKKPYRPIEYTQEFIEERGRLALYRALNIGRVIAFVGSGATTAYGRPEWRDLVKIGIKALEDEIEKVNGNSGDHVKSAKVKTAAFKEQKKVLVGLSARIQEQKTTSDTLLLALETAERLAKIIGAEGTIRQAIAEELGKSRTASRAANFETPLKGWGDKTFEIKDYPSTLLAMAKDLSINRYLTLNYDVEIEREFAQLYRTQNSSTEQQNANPAGRGNDFHKLIKYVPSQGGHAFDDAVDFSDGVGQSVLSVNLSSDNIGDLVNFAMLPSRYQAQVFHLHGRFDDPKSMVLTESDYQQRYLGSGERSFSFDEALDTVFRGNDILLVGLGMGEADMFRPLRQFAGQDRGGDLSTRNVYLLRERAAKFDFAIAKVDGDPQVAAGEEGIKKWLSKFVEGPFKKIDAHDEMPDGREADYFTDTEFSLKMKTQYDISTIFYGDDEMRLLLGLSDGLSAIARADLSQQTQKRRSIALLKYLKDNLVGGDLLNQEECNGIKCQIGKEIETLEWMDSLFVNSDALDSWAKSFKSIIRSRALTLALKDLEEKRAHWWDDWRQLPKPRATRFTKEYLQTDKQERYPCLSRHRPKYMKLTGQKDAPYDKFTVLKNLRAEVKKSQFEGDKPGRRVLRIAMPRGSGKGALMHLLQQENGQVDQSILDDLFSKTKGYLGLFKGQKSFRYHGAFLGHLSFSMEFASVVNSMARFTEDALIGLFVDDATRKQAVAALKSLIRSTSDPVLHRLWTHKDKFGDFADPKKENREKLREKIAHDLFLACELGEPRSDSNARSHRIELCRGFLNAFGKLVDRMDKRDELRLFLCFSGLDRLCDDQGIAYNPMYRAFFRLLTGCGEKYQDESNPELPIDLLLISGSPNTPTRYLSDEMSEVEMAQKKQSPDETVRENARKYQKLAGHPLYLKPWPVMNGFLLADRFWLKESTSENIRDFHKALVPDEASTGIRQNATIRQYLSRGVALSSWCAGAFDAVRYTEGHVEGDAARFLNKLDDAADRSGFSGITAQVIGAHRDFYRQMWIEGVPTSQWPNTRADLFELVLKHLALFPLPVELRVLYGCDEIHAKLHEICKAMNGGFETQPRALQRAQCICELETMLKQLSERHLIIAVKPKAVQDGAAGRQDASSVHVRYILQNQLRGYICTEMDLSVPDNGEKNFFQLSLYCDQPKDLPTPTADHYELFRSILDRQTLHCRQTLWCLHQVKVDPDAPTGSAPIWEVDPGFAYSGLRRRLAGDVEVSNSLKSLELDADLSSFHSVSQRIRAMYGLLRGSFSVGAITRLDRLHDDDAADEPLKRFGGWLRGVTNAAISAGELQERTDELGSLSKDRNLTLKASGNLLECTTNTALAPLAQPLYRDEFGWLFNERGVIALVQGHLYDAIPLFERAIVVMNHRDVRQQRDASLHAAVRRATLNLAIAQIERGNLEKAQGLISGLLLPEDPSAHLGSTISWVGAGYMGLIKHLGGDHSGALAAYDRVIKTAEEKEMLRLQSIFRRHRADLHRQMLHFKEAADDANLALAAAKQSAQRDLYWAAQLTLVKLALSQDQHSDSSVNKRLEDGLLYARNMSIPRLESEALRLQSALLLKFGDRLLAGRLAASAAAIARASGLRLMKVAAMRQYARVLAERGNLRNSVQISTQAHREAERRGYLNHAES